MIQSLLLCTGVSLGRAWAHGAETDGSSSCRSEHKTLEHSLQSVVLVLNIDRSKTASVWSQLGAPSSCKSSLFPFSSPPLICSQPPRQSPFPAMNLSPCSYLLHLVLSLCTCTPLWLCHVSVTQSHLSHPANVRSGPFPPDHPVWSRKLQAWRVQSGNFGFYSLLIAK